MGLVYVHVVAVGHTMIEPMAMKGHPMAKPSLSRSVRK